MLVLSAYVKDTYASRLLADGAAGVGSLLKSASATWPSSSTPSAVLDGGTVMDPEVVSQPFSRRCHDDPIRSLTPREREVLALVAQGLGNAAIAQQPFVFEAAVSKHIGHILLKLDLAPSDTGHRRVLAAPAYLRS